MALYDSNNKVQKWRYEPKQMYILVGSEKITIPNERLKTINIVKDYVSNLYPIFQIQLVLASDQYYKIMKNKNDLKFYLRIDKYYFYEDKSSKADGSVNSLYQPWINETFKILLDDNTEDMELSLDKEANKSNYEKVKNDNSDELEKVDNGVTFYLYKVTDELKDNVNAVFDNITVTDALVWLLNKSGMKNIIMQSPDNTKKYDTLVIPNLSISKALYFIDTYYGIYKLGTIFFCDFDYNYIIPFDPSNRTAFLSNEIKTTNIIIPKSAGTSDHTISQGVLKKTKSGNMNYIVGSNQLLSIANDSISGDLIDGSDTTAIDSYSGTSETYNSNAKTATGSTTTKVVTNETENDYYAAMKSALTKAKSTVITVELMDFDIEMIKPHKNYNMLFEETNYTKKYNGKYTVTSAEHSLNREGDAFTLNTKLILCKMS